MGELVNLSLVLADLPTLFALTPSHVTQGQIAAVSLSTSFIAVDFWKKNRFLSAKHVTTGYQLQQDILCPTPSLSFVKYGVYP
jgi:hypothetical protein